MRQFYQELLDVLQTSDSPCYRYYDEEHTYAEMNLHIQKLNTVLRSLDDQRVIVYAEKSFENYCALFAILLSGNTWVPINPSHPTSRKLHAIEQAEPALILTDRSLPQELQEYVNSHDIAVANVNQTLASSGLQPVELGDFDPNRVAYIMFTSGSTGTPKGVPMTHGNYIPFVRNALDVLPLGKNEVFSDFQDLGFDISIFYLFCSILTESVLVPFIQKAEQFFPVDSIVRNGITVWSSVPSVVSRVKMLRPDDNLETPLKVMFLCGEPLSVDILQYCQDKLAVPEVYNFYGLTETGVENFYYHCQPGDADRFSKQGYLPIGEALTGNSIRVNDEGELWLAGPQITPGYLGGIEASRFVEEVGTRWFRTGDIVQIVDGLYFCKGRMDSQVKLSGYRVELMDVEIHVKNRCNADNVVCFVVPESGRNVLHCAIEMAGPLDVCEMKHTLKQAIQHYMVPERFFVVASFPRNKNGKIDRKAVARACVFN